jgi:DNA-directed RNA polymerase beta subunit
LINAEGDGVIEYVDANIITIKYDRSEEEVFDSDEKTYNLIKFRKPIKEQVSTLTYQEEGIEWFLVKYYPKDMQLKMVN